MPCFFQSSRFEASDELTTSTAWTLLAYSWPTRWNTRSAPVRSTRTSMPSNFALNAAAMPSATDRSIEVYQTTLPSFFAASISCGVIVSAGGASARAGAANTVPSASAVEPLRTSRRDGFLFPAFMASFLFLLSFQRAAAFGRQRQPHFGALGDRVVGRRHDAQHGAVCCLDHVVAAGAEKHLAGHGGLDDVLQDLVLRSLRRLRRKLDVVLADRDRGGLPRAQGCADHLQHGA